MNLIPYVAIWAVIGLAVLGLALYRKILTLHGDDEFVHLSEGEQQLIPQQLALSNKLVAIDRWGKILTVVTTVAGLLILAVVLFEAWQASLQLK
jgi:hypothetical protein